MSCEGDRQACHGVQSVRVAEQEAFQHQRLDDTETGNKLQVGQFLMSEAQVVQMYVLPRGRPRRRWKDNIKIDLQEVGCGGMDWIDLAQDRDR